MQPVFSLGDRFGAQNVVYQAILKEDDEVWNRFSAIISLSGEGALITA